MEYRVFQNGGERISLLGMGCMRLPVKPDKTIDVAEAQSIIDLAYQSGVNYFDTAYVYHNQTSELFLGEALKKYPRESYYLATKMPVFLLKGPADFEGYFNEQLARCQTGYFDFYLMHSLSAESFAKAEQWGLYGFLEQKRQEGKIRYIGFSFHDEAPALDAICAAHPWDFAQIQLNYVDYEAYRSREQMETLQKYNLPCVLMEPVKGGVLADLGAAANAVLKAALPEASVASWAMRYAAGFDNVFTVLSGMSTLPQLQDNIATYSPLVPLSAHEQAVLADAKEVFLQHFTIACTACRYCMPCPAGVDIPGVFALYNQAVLYDGLREFEVKYAVFPAEQKGGNCTACGQCEAICPQRLPVPQLLGKLEAGEGVFMREEN